MKNSFGMLRFDPFKMTEKIPLAKVRNRMLDVLLNVGIPFNRWLGMRIAHISDEKVVIISPPTTLRQNHVGGAHACALALLGEYPAGLLVARHYSIDQNRFIISSLSMEYKKQGKGTLVATSLAPDEWPEVANSATSGVAGVGTGSGAESNGTWVEMQTDICNKKGETVAVCKTRWQVKAWDAVRSR